MRPAAAEPPGLSKAALDRVLQAARAQVDGGTDAHHAQLSRRSRLSGLLPKLRLGLRRGSQYDLYRDLSYDTGASRTSADEHLTLEASAVFELDRLVFSEAEVRIARLRRVAKADVEARVREVISLVFEFELRWLDRAAAAEQDLALDLEIAQLKALLDALTGGAFSQIWGAQRGELPRRAPASGGTH